MKLMTKAIENKLAKYPIYSQDGKGDAAKVICKFFPPWGDMSFYVTEGNKLDNGDWEFFGLVTNCGEAELGYFRLSELEDLRGPWGLKVERDRYFEGTIADAKKDAMVA